VDARRAPPVLPHHATDKLAKLRIDGWTSLLTGDASPVTAMGASVPGDDSAGLNDSECLAPIRPQIAQRNPEEAIDRDQLWTPAMLLTEGGELLSQGEILEHQRTARQSQSAQGAEDELQQEEHPGRMRAGFAMANKEEQRRWEPVLCPRSGQRSFGEAQVGPCRLHDNAPQVRIAGLGDAASPHGTAA
jgi:hypothetical protein